MVTEGRFDVVDAAGATLGEVSSILMRPDEAGWLYVFGHGAGAGMRHKSMQSTADALAAAGIATFRYNFLYMEQRKGAPDRKPALHAAVRSAVAEAARLCPDLRLAAGGRSMGGRMTSEAQAASPLPGVQGLVFFAFPLHPSGKPGVERAEHLAKVDVPTLFLQGDRDTLAEMDLLVPVCESLPHATLKVVPSADHSFHVQKSSGINDAQAQERLADWMREWLDSL